MRRLRVLTWHTHGATRARLGPAFSSAPAAVAQTTLHLHTGAPDGQSAALAGRDATLQVVATARSADA